MPSFFCLEKVNGHARAGRLMTARGIVETPVFMPVGTRGAIKALTTEQIHALGPKLILGNTYHLMLRPGTEIIEKAGGLAAFMAYSGSILTDSGGFQVFSLSGLRKVTPQGVFFQSHIDGSKHFLGPKEAMAIQKVLRSDIVMAFDECVAWPCDEETAKNAVIRTLDWAKQCQHEILYPHQQLFAIVQGSCFEHLRCFCAKELTAMDFPGYAIGGLSVGEQASLMYEMIDATVAHLPDTKPRYLMGVGTPRNIVEAVKRGIDMFDCVMPTRNARNGTAFTWAGKINIKAAAYARDFSPLDSQLSHPASQHSKAYIRHLLNVDEMTAAILLTEQNLAFYLDFMKKMRQAISNDSFESFYKDICLIYPN